MTHSNTKIKEKIPNNQNLYKSTKSKWQDASTPQAQLGEWNNTVSQTTLYRNQRINVQFFSVDVQAGFHRNV